MTLLENLKTNNKDEIEIRKDLLNIYTCISKSIYHWISTPSS